MISKAGDCLRKPGAHMYYIGVDTFGLIGSVVRDMYFDKVCVEAIDCNSLHRLIDGAEMLDTFGASVDDVRGFVKGGWATCDNACGS